MRTALSAFLCVAGIAACSVAYAQSAYTPETCRKQRPIFDAQLNEAQDRYDKAKEAARNALPFLIEARDNAMSDAKTQVQWNVAYMATLGLNTMAKITLDILKLDPKICAASKGIEYLTKAAIEGAKAEKVFADVLKPTIVQIKSGSERPDPKTVEALALAAAGEAFGCATAGFAVTAGYNLGKNVNEISIVDKDSKKMHRVLVENIATLERAMQRHLTRIVNTGNELLRKTIVQKDLEASCASPASTADSASDFKKLIALADQADKQDKLDLRSALDRAEQCMDMNCVTEALAGASKLTRGSGDRMLVFKARERADVRVGLLIADEEIRKNNIARAEQNKQAAAQAAQADEVDQAIQAAIMGVLVNTATSLLSDRVRESTQTAPQRAPATTANSAAGAAKEKGCTIVRAKNLPCRSFEGTYGYRWSCPPGIQKKNWDGNDWWCSPQGDMSR
jgi:hypothetical protein